MDHYIVKIYRRARKQPRQLTGMVEDVATGGTQTFHNLDQLGAILGAAPEQVTRAKSHNRHRKTDIEPNT